MYWQICKNGKVTGRSKGRLKKSTPKKNKKMRFTNKNKSIAVNQIN
jgi:hypothetical protein